MDPTDGRPSASMDRTPQSAYRAPRLLMYGAMFALTAAGSKGAPEGAGGMAPADKTRS